jgi:hypothetical protein
MRKQIAELKRRTLALARNNRKHSARLQDLLSTKDIQELLYQNMVASPFTAPAVRMPVTLLTGAIPVSLWKVNTSTSMTANSSGFCCASMEGDMWYGKPILGPDSSTGTMSTHTFNTYVGTTTPAVGSAAVGVSNTALPDVSPAFTSDANSGTEYIHLAGGLAVYCEAPGNDPPTWSGNVLIVNTDDPNKSPLTGLTQTQLYAAAAKDGSDYQLSEFKVTQSGLFVPVFRADAHSNYPGAVGDAGAVGAIGGTIFPLVHTAYDWNIVNTARVSTIQKPSLMVIAYNLPSSAVLKITLCSIYMTERYGSYEVRGTASIAKAPIMHNVSDLMGGVLSQHKNKWQLYGSHAQALPGGAHLSPHVVNNNLANKANSRPGFLSQLASLGKKGLAKLWNSGVPQGLAYNALTSGGKGFAPPHIGGGVTSIEMGPSGPPGHVPPTEGWGSYLVEEVEEIAPEILELAAV